MGTTTVGPVAVARGGAGAGLFSIGSGADRVARIASTSIEISSAANAPITSRKASLTPVSRAVSEDPRVAGARAAGGLIAGLCALVRRAFAFLARVLVRAVRAGVVV